MKNSQISRGGSILSRYLKVKKLKKIIINNLNKKLILK